MTKITFRFLPTAFCDECNTVGAFELEEEHYCATCLKSFDVFATDFSKVFSSEKRQKKNRFNKEYGEPYMRNQKERQNTYEG
jgi:predicted amidophosphoribosyltransferase